MKYVNNYKLFESQKNKEYLYDLIEDVRDFPAKGITFKDISYLLSDYKAVNIVVNDIYEQLKNRDIDILLGLDARGFILGPMIANKLGVGFAMARKKGKAPEHYVYKKYNLEYGTNEMGVSPNIIKEGMKVHVHDDLLATGGSVNNVISLIQEMGGFVDSVSFIIELDFLKGREKLEKRLNISNKTLGYDIYSVLHY
jgi:adenine phosphoribosyltransferase